MSNKNCCVIKQNINELKKNSVYFFICNLSIVNVRKFLIDPKQVMMINSLIRLVDRKSTNWYTFL